MSCACEHKKLSSEIDRIRRLAKATAKLHGCEVVLYRNEDGTYNFADINTDIDKPIIEIISQY